MSQQDMDYLINRLGQAFLAAGQSLIGAGSPPDNPPDDVEDDEPVIIDTVPALGQVGVIANRCPLRTEPTKAINVDLGRLLEGEKVPLDKISDDGKWYRVDVRAFAGKHTIPDDATYAWAEASNFEVIILN